MNPADAGIPPLDLSRPDLRENPYPVYHWYRENCPVYRLQGTTPNSPDRYMLTRFDDVSRYLKHPALRRGVHHHAPWNRPLDTIPPEQRAFAAAARQWPLFLDPPDHAKPRLALNRLLSPDFLKAIQPTVIDSIKTFLAQLPDDQPFDAIDTFSRLIPLEVNRRGLRLNDASIAALRQDGLNITKAIGTHHDPDTMAEASTSVENMLNLLDQAIDEQRRTPDPEALMLQSILDSAGPDGPISNEQIPPLALLMFLTALDTTANLIGNGLLTFLRHPLQLEKFINNVGPEIDARAVSEITRFEASVQQVTRHAIEPLEIRGVPIPKKAGVSFLLGAANRDPAFTPDPDTFDISRQPSPLSSFGHGIHRCPGADLGQQIATAAWRAFFTRFPHAKLEDQPLNWFPLVTFRGVSKLQIHGNS
ncbi:MAG: cytochrome P450 [Verrucomicrobiota bacterium]